MKPAKSFTSVLDKLDSELSKKKPTKGNQDIGDRKKDSDDVKSDADKGKDPKEPDESLKGEPSDMLDCPHCSGSGKKKR